MNLNTLVIILLFFSGVISCSKFVSIDPPGGQLDQSKIFQNEVSALAALSSVYFRISEKNPGFASGSNASVTICQGLYTDELISYFNNQSASFYFYNNNLSTDNSFVSSMWSNAYAAIYECNRIIEGLSNLNNIPAAAKNQFTGEALFLRAFCYFYLANMYGDIPLITTSDYAVNASMPEAPASQVYQQIIADLVEAKGLLNDAYPSEERVRVNKSAAIALLSRVYLFSNDFINAEIAASEIIIKSNQYKLMVDLNNVFLKSSEEAIWQLLPLSGKEYTNEGQLLILRAAPPTQYSLRNSLYLSFEAGDQRRLKWVDSIVSTSGLSKWYFPFKYKQSSFNSTGDEYSMVLRLAEQYLIRAEARLKQDKLLEAKADIDTIRSRAGLMGTNAVTKDQLMTAIEEERRHELFTEWGHRFFDLKRWKRLDAVLGPQKQNWNSSDSLLPIPQSELLLNKNLTQNDGYN